MVTLDRQPAPGQTWFDFRSGQNGIHPIFAGDGMPRAFPVDGTGTEPFIAPPLPWWDTLAKTNAAASPVTGSVFTAIATPGAYGPNPQGGHDARGYNFNGNAGDVSQATGFFPTLIAAEEAWHSAHPSPVAPAAAAPVPVAAPAPVPAPAAIAPIAGPSLAAQVVAALASAFGPTAAAPEAVTASPAPAAGPPAPAAGGPASAADAMISAGLSSGYGIPGAGSIATQLPGPVVTTQTRNGGSPLIAILALVAIGGILFFIARSRKKAAIGLPA